MGSLHQDVHAVGADPTDGEGGRQTEEQAGVLESHGHGQDAAAQ